MIDFQDSSKFLQGNAGQKVEGLKSLDIFDNPYQHADTKGYDWGGGFLNAGLQGLAGAGTGALLGPWGAVAGGVIGLGTGIWNAFSGNDAQEEANAKAEEYNRNLEAQKAQELSLRKDYNQKIIDQWSVNNNKDNLNNYMQAVGPDVYQKV